MYMYVSYMYMYYNYYYSQGIGHSGEITRIKIAPNGKHIVSVSADGAIIRWRIPTTEQQQPPMESLMEQTNELSLNEGEEIGGANTSQNEEGN